MLRPTFLKGRGIELVPLGRDDAATTWRWMNDLDIVLAYGSDPFPVTLQSQQDYLAGLSSRKDSLMLGIRRKGHRELIGIGGLSHIEWVNQRGELAICIGEHTEQGQGYGTEATRLILNHAFTRLNLHSVLLRVIAYNTRAQRCYEKCGFRLLGRRREAKPVNGQYHDVLYMDILAKEFPGKEAPRRQR
jgi:RimJ/RimL family protein N-acetyltransferase